MVFIPHRPLTTDHRSPFTATCYTESILPPRWPLMLCPWCMHYGPEDDEYVFDDELYCGICAQQMPRSQLQWDSAYKAMEPSWYEHVERELNHIISSRSGLAPPVREGIGKAIDAYRDRRLGVTPLPLSEEEYANWFKFACTYFAPSGLRAGS